MPEITKPNPFLDDKQKKKFSSLNCSPLAFAEQKKKKFAAAQVNDDEDGSGSGTVSLSVEQLNAYLLACLTKERRQGQKKFGPVPFTDDPNNILGRKPCQRGSEYGELPHVHPLLAHSQQFSGDDPKISAIPSDNPIAKERYPELRLQNQLRQNPSLGRHKSVTLSR